MLVALSALSTMLGVRMHLNTMLVLFESQKQGLRYLTGVQKCTDISRIKCIEFMTYVNPPLPRSLICCQGVPQGSLERYQA